MPTPKEVGGPRLCRGFTLIEMLVVLAISALLALAGTQLAIDWVHSAHTRQARSQLMSALEETKALALRNPCEARLPQAAAQLVAVQQGAVVVLQVTAVKHSSSPTGCDAMASSLAPHWDSRLPAGVGLQLNSQDLVAGVAKQVAALDSRGGTATTVVNFRLFQGSSANDETGQFL